MGVKPAKEMLNGGVAQCLAFMCLGVGEEDMSTAVVFEESIP